MRTQISGTCRGEPVSRFVTTYRLATSIPDEDALQPNRSLRIAAPQLNSRTFGASGKEVSRTQKKLDATVASQFAHRVAAELCLGRS
jgi:hypothetical protein